MNTDMFLDSHCFALHVTNLRGGLPPHEVPTLYRSTDLSLIRRVRSILRLKIDDRLVLFDEAHRATAQLSKLSDRELSFLLSDCKPHEMLRPQISWLLPLLKREAFEQALYTLTEMGVTSIQPIKTKKSLRTWGSPKDYTRAHSIMIAACEQSKQFVVPQIKPVRELSECEIPSKSILLFFDAGGQPLIQILKTQEKPESILVCSGPEGDLSPEEKDALKKRGFTFCRLTQTVLRAQQAVAVGLGILRTWY